MPRGVVACLCIAALSTPVRAADEKPAPLPAAKAPVLRAVEPRPKAPAPSPQPKSAAPQAADTPKFGAPKVEFLDRNTIRRADGMIVWFYRVNFVDPETLVTELNHWKSPKGQISVEQATIKPAKLAPSSSREMAPSVVVQSVLRIQEVEENLGVLERVLEMRDVPEPQVYIEAKIVEVDYTDELRIGVEAQIDRPLADTFFRNYTASFVNSIPGASSDLSFATTDKFLTFDYLLQLAQAGAKTEVRSSPGLMASQGHAARVLVGEREPIVEQKFSGTNIIATTKFEDVGLALNVQPLQIGRDYVRVRLSTELSRVSEFRTTGLSADSSVTNPVISRRTAETVLTVPDAETVVFSGLLQTAEVEQTTGIPILKDIPLVGGLFGSTTKQESKTELVFFVTLTIQRPMESRLIVPPGEAARSAAETDAD